MSSNDDEQKIVSIEKENDNKTIYRVCKNRDNPYVMLNKGFFDDPSISLKSKGLLGYLLSKPDNWIVYRSEILKHCTDGIDSLKSAIKELKKSGYMKIEPERNEEGKVVRWLTVVFEAPQSILKAVPVNPQVEKPLLDKKEKNPQVEKPQVGFSTCGKSTPTNNNLPLNNDNNKQPHIAQITNIKFTKPPYKLDRAVVVSLMEKVQQWAIAETLVKTWLKQHSAEYILEKIEYTKTHSTTNPAGFLRKAIEHDYKKYLANDSKQEQKLPVALVWPSHEENIAWYASLSNEEKQSCFREATHKHAHFEEMLKIERMDFKSMDFLKTTWFKMMMQILGRTK
jgi:phosphopantetheinyl transferase (holo-ACP synthase)